MFSKYRRKFATCHRISGVYLWRRKTIRSTYQLFSSRFVSIRLIIGSKMQNFFQRQNFTENVGANICTFWSKIEEISCSVGLVWSRSDSNLDGSAQTRIETDFEIWVFQFYTFSFLSSSSVHLKRVKIESTRLQESPRLKNATLQILNKPQTH